VGVLEPCGDLDLALEPLPDLLRRPIRMNRLDRDRPVVLAVLCQVDRSHPALAEHSLELVAVAQLFVESLMWVEHRLGPPVRREASVHDLRIRKGCSVGRG